MKWKTKLSLVTLLILLTACSAPPPEPTLTPQPTSTPEPETLDELAEWDLVYMSDSTGSGIPYILKSYIEEDTGKSVILHDYVISGLPAYRVLKALRGETENMIPEKMAQLAEVISEAEVIIFYGNPEEIPEMEGVERDIRACMNHGKKPPDQCQPEVYQPYTEVLEEIYEEIFRLRDGKPTIIRAADFYNPMIKWHRNFGIEDECVKCWTTFNEAVWAAAEAYNVPVVSAYRTFNGPDYREDPLEKGYLGNDRTHPGKEGMQAMAETIRQAGYDPVQP